MIEKKIKKQAGKVDKIVTGLIIGGAVAGAIGMSKTKTGKQVLKKGKETAESGVSFVGKSLSKVFKIFKKNDKTGKDI